MSRGYGEYMYREAQTYKETQHGICMALGLCIGQSELQLGTIDSFANEIFLHSKISQPETFETLSSKISFVLVTFFLFVHARLT